MVVLRLLIFKGLVGLLGGEKKEGKRRKGEEELGGGGGEGGGFLVGKTTGKETEYQE